MAFESLPIASTKVSELGSASIPLAGTESALIVQGGVTVKVPVSGFGGLLYFSQTKSTASPNATVPVVSFMATGSEADIDIALVPKGLGSFTLQVPDGTTAGGDKRGIRAIDLQLSRNNANQVAYGSESIAIGFNNRSAGIAIGGNNTITLSAGLAIGNGNTVSGSGAAVGNNHNLSGSFSFVSGVFGSDTGLEGVRVFSSSHFGALSSIGNCQLREAILRRETTNATTGSAVVSGTTNNSTNCAILQNNSSVKIIFDVVARQNTTGDSKEFTVTCLASRGADASTTAIIGSPVATSSFASAGAAAWAVALSVNTTLGAVSVQVTGEASKTIRWVVHSRMIEVVFN